MKIKHLLVLSTITMTSLAGATTLKERDPSVYNYDVLFTNPTCSVHDYGEQIRTQGGDYVRYTPENVFCSSRSDRNTTARRDGSDNRIGYNESPQHRLLDIINSSETKEMFMTYLSFSDSTVARALCSKMSEDGMKLELIIDKINEQGSIDRTLERFLKPGERLSGAVRARIEAYYEGLKEDAKNEVIKYAKMRTRTASQEEKYEDAKKDYEGLLTKSQYLGSVLCSKSGVTEDQDYTVKRISKRGGIGWAHTKIIMVNPNDKKKVTTVFSSANMSSGTTIHHENWHFVTAATESHFVQIHKCIREAEFKYTDKRTKFRDFIKKCRGEIVSEMKLAEEEDIKVFVVPGEGEEAVETFTGAIKWSENIDMAAHRFTLNELEDALIKAKKDDAKVRMVFDDDMYLAGERILADGVRVPNMPNEYRNVLGVLGGKADATLEKSGAEARYMQTNHYAHTIHHNKYLILDNAKTGRGKPDMYKEPAVFCGAGNFTKAAFMMSGSTTNLENYYYITIPEVVEAFEAQYDYKWNKLATKYSDLPTKDIEPKPVD